MHVGDQAKKDVLRKLIRDAGIVPGEHPWLSGEGQFDIIIDDGGHYPDQIKTSFRVLFHSALRPGGVYVIEDIGPMRAPYSGREYNDGQMITWAQGLIATILGNAGSEPLGFDIDPMNMHASQARWVLSAEIFRNALTVVKATERDCQASSFAM